MQKKKVPVAIGVNSLNPDFNYLNFVVALIPQITLVEDYTVII